jgi:ferredoxin-type protein NapH
LNRFHRRIVQIVSTIGINANFKGFIKGEIYTGKIKGICVPGLNCSSCPGALGSCPLGALQDKIKISPIQNTFFYITSFLFLSGLFFGRFVCGWICPFGFIQEMLYKIPLPKIKSKVFRKMEFLKYVFLAIFIISLVLINTNYGYPLFCKYVCIVEVLEAKIPFLILKPQILSYEGLFFYVKLFLLIAVVLLSIMVFRPFCRFFCSLGAFYALFNPISFVRIKLDNLKCLNCGSCKKACQIDIDVRINPDSMECIRCGECIAACPTNSIKIDKRWLRNKERKMLPVTLESGTGKE